MNSTGTPDRAFDRFVAVARHQLALLKWDEIEPSLAVSWGELNEPELPPWDSVADKVRCAALEGRGASELRGLGDGRSAPDGGA